MTTNVLISSVIYFRPIAQYIYSPEPEEDHDDTLFDQYLRSPSPSPPPSPDDAASELSGVTLIDAERHQSRGSLELCTETLKSPAPESVCVKETESQFCRIAL
jgi:hypothetical protein